MAFYLVLAFAALSIAAPSMADERSDAALYVQWSREGQTLLLAAGQTLGAASMCKEISGVRVDAAADRLSAMVDDSAKSEADVSAARNTFRAGAEAGRHAVASGVKDCGQAAAELTGLERQLSR
jgi:hypothetical protein